MGTAKEDAAGGEGRREGRHAGRKRVCTHGGRSGDGHRERTHSYGGAVGDV